MNRVVDKKTIVSSVLGFVGDTVVTLVCEAFVGVVTKMNLKMSICHAISFIYNYWHNTNYKEFYNYPRKSSCQIIKITAATHWCKK